MSAEQQCVGLWHLRERADLGPGQGSPSPGPMCVPGSSYVHAVKGHGRQVCRLRSGMTFYVDCAQCFHGHQGRMSPDGHQQVQARGVPLMQTSTRTHERITTLSRATAIICVHITPPQPHLEGNRSRHPLVGDSAV